MVHILGISAYYHDSAAALLRDGHIVAAAQEERFTRKKHDPRFPQEAIRFCLHQAGISLSEVSSIVFYDKPLLKFERLLESYLANAPRGWSSFLRAMPVWIKEKLYLKQILRKEFEQLGASADDVNLLFSEHHQSHAASAFFPSPFDDAAVLCVDGVGEWATTSAWAGKGNELSPLWEIQFPHSLGLLYSAFTGYCGFKVNSGEYKLMGMAPYGQPKYEKTIRDHLIDIKEDGSFHLDMSYFDYVTGLRMTNRKFHRLFGADPLSADEPPRQLDLDLAASIQKVTEEVMLRLARTIHRDTGAKNLCMAGGVALNCVANGRLLREGPFERLWIQPAAGDAGGALGAAYTAWHQHLGQPRKLDPGRPDLMRGSALGPEFRNDQIVAHLEEAGFAYRQLGADELFDKTAQLIADGMVVGWFQGPAEFGPRALGNRSILGDARSPDMQSRMNLKIKFRESFRPFAPSVLRELVSEYFEIEADSPYMLLVADVREDLRTANSASTRAGGLEQVTEVRSTLPAITHVDYSARVQTVSEQDNPHYYKLISAFRQHTGCGVIINTSFNVRGEPPVCSPADATACFMQTDMDALVMGDCLLMKSEQPQAMLERDWGRSFDAD